MCTIFIDLILDFLPHSLVIFNLLRTSFLQIVDFLSNLSHSLLEVFCQICSLFALFIQHCFMLQVQVMILL